MRKHCLLCGELTEGSISAAGNFWDRICHICRASEDAAAALQAKSIARGFKLILGSFGLGEPGSGESARQTPVDKAVQSKSLEVDTLRKEEKMEAVFITQKT